MTQSVSEGVLDRRSSTPLEKSRPRALWTRCRRCVPGHWAANGQFAMGRLCIARCLSPPLSPLGCDRARSSVLLLRSRSYLRSFTCWSQMQRHMSSSTNWNAHTNRSPLGVSSACLSSLCEPGPACLQPVVMVSYPKFIARVLCGFSKKGIQKHTDIICSHKRVYTKLKVKSPSKKKRSKKKKKKHRRHRDNPNHETAALLGISVNTVLLSDDEEEVQGEKEEKYDLMRHTSHALHLALVKATDYARGLPQDLTMQLGPFDRKNKGVRDIDVGELPKKIPNIFRYRFSRTPVRAPPSHTMHRHIRANNMIDGAVPYTVNVCLALNDLYYHAVISTI